MKKLFAVVALAAVVASPALAQTSKRVRAENPHALAATAQAVHQPKHGTNPSYDVYSQSGNYVGSDPDPQVRSMLQRDAAEEGND